MGIHFICGDGGVVVLCNTKEINIHFLFAFALVITTNTRRITIINSTSTTNIIDTSIRTVINVKKTQSTLSLWFLNLACINSVYTSGIVR